MFKPNQSLRSKQFVHVSVAWIDRWGRQVSGMPMQPTVLEMYLPQIRKCYP